MLQLSDIVSNAKSNALNLQEPDDNGVTRIACRKLKDFEGDKNAFIQSKKDGAVAYATKLLELANRGKLVLHGLSARDGKKDGLNQQFQRPTLGIVQEPTQDINVSQMSIGQLQKLIEMAQLEVQTRPVETETEVSVEEKRAKLEAELASLA